MAVSMNDPLDWYWKALAGRNPPVTTTPECGFFLTKVTLNRGQDNEHTEMWPGSIYWEGATDEDGKPTEDQVLRCEIGGKQCDPLDNWLSLAKRPVTVEEYTYWLTQLFNEAST